MKFYLTATAAALMMSAVAVMPVQAEQLTLDECIAIALSESPTVKIADMEITRVDYSRRDALSQLLPTINFGASYNRMIAKQVAYMNLDAFAGLGGGGNTNTDADATDESETPAQQSRASSAGNGFKMGLDNSFSIGFTAGMPLIAPQLWKSIQLTESQILRNVEQARASRLNLVNQVKSAYYALLLAKDSQRVIQQSYDMAALTHDIYTKKYEAGAASDYDVLRTSVAMKNVEPELIASEIAIKRCRLQLLILMGVDADFPLEVAGELADYEATMYGDVLNLDTDYSNNSQLVLNDIDQRTLQQTIELQKAAWYPTLSLSFNYNWTSSSNGSPLRNFRWNPYSVLGLTLSVPVFEGGRRVNAIRTAQVQLDEMRWQRETLDRSVSMQVALARDNINLNVKQIASCSESVGQADRAHNIMERSFAIGAATYLDLRDSELALTRSQLAYYQAIYNYLIANSELELLLGNAPIESYTLPQQAN